MPEDLKPLSDAHLQELMERAAIRAVTDTFRLLGIDITEMGDVNDMRDDLRYIRRQRESHELRRNEASKSVVTAVIGGIVGMLVSAVTWLVTIMRHQP